MVPDWMTWTAWTILVISISWLVGWSLFGNEDRVMWFLPKRAYRVIEHEKTDWGTMFAIVSPKGEIVGLDRYTQAKQRCATLNRG